MKKATFFRGSPFFVPPDLALSRVNPLLHGDFLCRSGFTREEASAG
ncbi:hypothetical protein PRJ_5344 [Pseudomonas sp. XWY-1]|nr:hypothetical protein PRJ_5344 [Pseudomonas sp. XWY-1]